MKTVHYFGQDIVLFRGLDGRLSAFDPYCPHLGAHFGHGSRVEGNTLVCPYHGWRFAEDGECVKIPYCEKIPKKARVRTWRLEEKYENIYVFFDPSGEPANYSLPLLPDLDHHTWCDYSGFKPVISSRVQELLENAVDSPHFKILHGQKMPSMKVDVRGSELYVTQELLHRTWIKEFRTLMHIHMVEPGVQSLYFQNLPLGHSAILVASMTPVDENRVVNFMSISVERKFPVISKLLQKVFCKNAMLTYAQDKAIWETKAYLRHPVLCEDDGPIFQVRRWYSQFQPSIE